MNFHNIPLVALLVIAVFTPLAFSAQKKIQEMNESIKRSANKSFVKDQSFLSHVNTKNTKRNDNAPIPVDAPVGGIKRDSDALFQKVEPL